ncbi:serine/threonine protein kinase [uncultured Pseudodesulfovibrio sp.]|uniref:serine/threonine protein kinase n=1 Tax=uncultured Pseudodesulfovibrio sp. TaxID=2035858 RepID=UPI0029C9738A|nr:serine/threonine protein kinase [uncultured Pseudodesulfovibrio sp.]
MNTVRELVEQFQPGLRLHDYGRIYMDTSEFMSIDSGDVIAVGGKHYLVYRDAVEQGLAYKDVKYWVKKCMELESGETKLLKLVFHESFYLEYGCVKIKCYRSPQKEARMLDLVRGDTRFMQGRSVKDEAGNRIRIIDFIQGKRIDNVVAGIKADHETYFHEHYPDILGKFIGACEAVAFLHEQGERHGDINFDHLMKEYSTGAYRWIDFDYAYEAHANPFGLDLFGLGRILACITGKWLYTRHTLHDLHVDIGPSDLTSGDFSCVYKNEIMNLKKLFPYIPTKLNNILLHFAESANITYDTVGSFIESLEEYRLVN